MRTHAIDQSLLQTISPQRLGKYLEECSGDIAEAITLYEWNLRVSEAFYAPLQCAEVCLRNALHLRLTQTFGEKWYADSRVPLNNASLSQIDSAIEELSKNGTDPLPGSVVAELKFSFWVGLLGPSYDEALWRKTLYRAFSVGAGRPRKICQNRFNVIRRFRNRVFHHEPIFQRDLALVHSEIMEAIGWMCSHTSAWAFHNSRVPRLLSGQVEA